MSFFLLISYITVADCNIFKYCFNIIPSLVESASQTLWMCPLSLQILQYLFYAKQCLLLTLLLED